MLETPFWIFCTGLIDSTGALPVYDVLEIKKKRASPARNNPYPVKTQFLYDKYNNTGTIIQVMILANPNIRKKLCILTVGCLVKYKIQM